MNNQFDNNISLLLKRARELAIPAKYVAKDSSSLIDKITAAIQTGTSLFNIFDQFVLKDKENLSAEDLAMLFVSAYQVSEDLLNIINNFYNSLIQNQIYEEKQVSRMRLRDVQELQLIKEDWINRYNQEFQNDMTKLENIEIIQEALSNNTPLPYSPIEITSSIISATMIKQSNKEEKENNTAIVVEDAPEIFDMAVPNHVLPYVRWNGEKGEHIKLFTGKTLEERPDYSKIIRLNSKENKNTLNFSVWNGSDPTPTKLLHAPRESFLKGSFNYSNNLMKIKIPIEVGDEKEVILQRITNSLNLVPTNIDETAISGEFFVFGIEIHDMIFAHMIRNDELVNTYLYMKEMTNSLATRKQLKVYFRSSINISEEEGHSVAFSITQGYGKGGEIVTDVEGKQYKLTSNYPYIRVNISSADSLEVANYFAKILSYILSYYNSNKELIRALFLSYIPNFNEDTGSLVTTSTKKAGRDASDTKVAQLKRAAPDLFITDYARKCLCQFQPIIVPDDEIEAWENKTFIHKGKEIKRQVMRFPPNAPDGTQQWNFVCPEDSAPFPGVKVNNLSNKDQYLGLPCCFNTVQITPEANSKYNKIYRNTNGKLKLSEITNRAQEKQEKGKQEKGGSEKKPLEEQHMVKTDKIVKSGRYGFLPISIENFLKTIVKNGNKFVRKGTLKSPNSFLHAVSLALDPTYTKLNEDDKEQYVFQIRKKIAQKVHSSLMKQEMYDFTDEEIAEQLNSNSFLDPKLFYRAIEETYNINVFVFAPSEDEPRRLNLKEESKGTLEYPRYKLFYARSPRERKSVLIYRTLGSESDNLYYPHCELIVEYDDENFTDNGLFEEDIYDDIFTAFLKLNKVMTWELISYESTSNFNEQKIQTVARENIYSRVNYMELFRNSPVAQYIDEYGKMRALIIPTRENENLCLIVPPSQPENLQMISSEEITAVSYAVSRRVLGVPIAVSPEKDGIWYPILDLVYGIFVPIRDISSYAELEKLSIGMPNPLGNKGLEVVPRIRKIQRDLDFFIQVVKWLFTIFLNSSMRFKDLSIFPSEVLVDEFISRYFVVVEEDKEVDSSSVYNFKNIGRKFPTLDGEITVELAIEEMRKRIPTMFTNKQGENKIKFYSKKFLEGVIYIFKQYVKEYTPTRIPIAINRILESEDDYRRYPGVALFLSEKDLRIWLESLNKNIRMTKSININDSGRSDPFMYVATDGHIYLIQNVMEGNNLMRALNVCYYWKVHKVNTGHQSYPYDEEEVPQYVLYEISAANTIVLTESHVSDPLSTSFFSVLKYPNGVHAALLPLL